MSTSTSTSKPDRLKEDAITTEVLARYTNTEDPRLREIMLSLISHLHSFAKDVRLQVDEWLAAADFLAKAGHWCTEGRQEFLALSALIGLETLVLEISTPKPEGATAPTVLGPFYLPDSPTFKNGEDLARGATGEPLFVSGRVLTTSGEPIVDATVEVWHSDDQGLYDVQGDLAKTGMWARGQLRTDSEGRYWFWSVTPVPYPSPRDGAIGDLFNTTSNSEWRPAHMHFKIKAAGYEAITTEIFVRGSRFLDCDPVFAVRPGLIADFPLHESGTAPDGTNMRKPYRSLAYDFVMTRAGR